MATKYYVKVSNLSPETTEQKLHDFFTYVPQLVRNPICAHKQHLFLDVF